MITLAGRGWNPGLRVRVGGLAAVVEGASETEIQLRVPVEAAPGGIAVVRVEDGTPGGYAAVLRVEPANAVVSARAAARFLEQATWGPTPQSIAEVRRNGFERYIEQQFTEPLSDYPEPPEANDQQSLTPAQRRFFTNAVNGSDQLRQRVAFALHQILVVSAVKMNQARMMVPYLRLLQANAFGNYAKILREITVNPAMGRYLDMVNNDKPSPANGIRANENYAREVMQLFTIGTVKLNQDGATVLDREGKPLPAYDQSDIEGLALALTGWTYAPLPGEPARSHNPVNYNSRMVPWEPNHDRSAKRLVDGVQLPAGQTAEQDLDAALRHLFEHPNISPFVARRLIGSLVTSNPSPEYIARVAAAFQASPSGERGDMKAVIRAILLDPEAREGDTSTIPAHFGHLREPVLYITAMLRSFGARIADPHSLASRASQMGQNVFYPPTVFSYFPLLYKVPNSVLVGPEYEVLTPSTTLARVNFADSVAFGRLGQTVTVDLTPYIDMASDTTTLLEALNNTLMQGAMSAGVRDAIGRAVEATTDPLLRAQTAVYLVAASPQYQTQR
ncbi:MAG: DUF1800 domain-containing protein [Acidobacteria bacterium]|nr:DUF1800 domain-containing protein [Acidobacteriota bacterium]